MPNRPGGINRPGSHSIPAASDDSTDAAAPARGAGRPPASPFASTRQQMPRTNAGLVGLTHLATRAGSEPRLPPTRPTRAEPDSFGTIRVDAARLWGAQTQRSLENFRISSERMPPELIGALAAVKSACAAVNRDLGLVDPAHANAVIKAAAEVVDGKHPNEFPLSVWQTGSGTQTNMNMNEVLANRGSEILGGQRGSNRLLHPNDAVNRGQSSNDIFPTAMHVAAAVGIKTGLMPSVDQLQKTLEEKSVAFADIVKIGRTHLQDATPMTLGQEFSGYAAQLALLRSALDDALKPLLALAVGGTAVGTGLNTHPDFGRRVAEELSKRFELPFHSADNKFAAIATHDPMILSHGTLKALAAAMTKIANDVRLLASGPRSGIGEIRIPENEPGSSIMPGKVNPTQCEAMNMACTQVIGNDVALTIGGATGHLELNANKPLIAHNFLQSLRLLTDGIRSFDERCAKGIEPNLERIEDLMSRSLMLGTALAPKIGYDRAARIAKKAHLEGTTLKEAAMASGLVTEEEFEQLVQPLAMTRPSI